MSFKARSEELSKKLATWVGERRIKIPRLPDPEGARQKDNGENGSALKTIPVGALPRWQEMEARLSELPGQARELLSPNPLDGGSPLFAKREQELKSLETSLGQWQEGRTQTVAVVGTDGCGRSSLLNQFQTKIAGESALLKTITLDRRVGTERELAEQLGSPFEPTEACTSTDDLVNLLSRQEKQILILDDVQFLMLRTPQSLGVMEHFISTLLATQDRFFWILSVTLQAWRRLDQLYNLSRYCTDVVTLACFEKDAAVEALRLRLEATGLPLAYEEVNPADPAGSGADSPGKDSEKDRKESLADCLFTGLYNLSRGSMKAALYYWQTFTAYDPDQKVLLILPIGEIDYSAVKKLDLDLLFSLGELLVHGPLTVREHACIFQR
ncbi:MAG: hypothetical protein R3231_08270, partial [bacterium]|nr:hypothetical protein [bacterium]